MVDVEKIKSDIEALKELTAEEYCKEAVEKIYAEFEASRENKIADLETALAIYDAYQVVEEAEKVTEEETAVVEGE